MSDNIKPDKGSATPIGVYYQIYVSSFVWTLNGVPVGAPLALSGGPMTVDAFSKFIAMGLGAQDARIGELRAMSKVIKDIEWLVHH